MEGVATGREPAARSYRSTSTGGVAVVLLFFGLVVIIEGIGAITDPTKSVAVGIVGVVGGVLWSVWVVSVVARMGVTTNDQGVVVRNWLRRRFVGWNAIAGFSFGADIPNLSLREMLSSPMLSTYVLLSDGRHLGLAGLSATRINRPKSRAKVQGLLDELEAQRRHFTRL